MESDELLYAEMFCSKLWMEPTNPSYVLSSIFSFETKITVQTMPTIITIKDICKLSSSMQGVT